MKKCKACGRDFASTDPKEEICYPCKHALKRLNGYAVPVVRCKDCLYWDRTAPLAYSCGCNFRTTEIHAEYTKADGFCSDAVFRESEDVSAPQWVKEPINDPNIVTESIG